MSVRDATPEEAAAIFTDPNFDTWIGVLGETAHICLSRGPGGVFGHNAVFETDDEYKALWRAARRKMKAWGEDEYFVHLEVGTPKSIADFWLKRASPAFVVLRGRV